MAKRFWYYLAALITAVILLTYYAINITVSHRQISHYNAESLENQKSSLENYLTKQTDPRKLISLAKRLKGREDALIQLVADKAYELAPDSRDAALLASAFHSELKDKLLELDPLYQE